MDYIDRDTAIKAIKTALKERSGRQWSVTGGRGTAWGWIRIQAVQKYAVDKYGTMTPEDAARLASLLGLERVSPQGISVPASGNYRREYIDRAAGRTPSVIGQPYWD